MKLNLPFKTIITVILLLVICILIWFGGPSIQISEVYLLKSILARALLISFILICYIAKIILQSFFSKKAEDQFVSSIVKTSSKQQAVEVKQYLTGVIKELKRQCLLGKNTCRSLYELPRYMVFGSPSAGKSTLLKNSGMNFLNLNTQKGSGIKSSQGITWHITDEAIFIEITGDDRAITWDAAVNANIQFELIEALKKYKVGPPASGVVFIIDICKLFLDSEASYKQKIEGIKVYVQNLSTRLEIKTPIYVILTKCDLLAGFLEYFEHIHDEDLKNVLGIILPNNISEGDLKKVISNQYDSLICKLTNYLPNILHQEADLQKRKRIALFPQQLQLLKDSIINGVDNILISSKLCEAISLRGIFFISASQENCIPYDLLNMALTRQFSLSLGSLTVQPNLNQSYFVTNIFKEIITSDGEIFCLVENNFKWVLDKIIYGLVLSILPISIIGLSINYNYYKHNIAATQIYLKQIETLKLQQDHPVASIQRILSILSTLQKAIDIYPISLIEKLAIPNVYPKKKTRERLQSVRQNVLGTMLLPFVAARLHDLIGIYVNDPKQLYDATRGYMVLKHPSTLPKDWLKKAVIHDIKHNLPINADQGKEFERYLDMALSISLPKMQIDNQLINRAIIDLRSFPLEERIYNILQEKANNAQLSNLDLTQALGTQSDQVFKSTGSLIIQGLYTNNGYVNFYLPKLPLLTKSITEDFKLMGITTEYQPSYKSMMSLVQKVNSLYFKDYMAQWKNTISNLQLIKCQNLPECLTLLSIMKAPDSPLINFLKTMEVNSDLPSMDVRTQKRPVLNAWYADLKNKEAHNISELVKVLNYLSSYISKINQADNIHHASFLALKDIVTDDTPLTKDDAPLVNLYNQFEKYPEPIRSWLKGLIDNILSILIANAKQHINETWQSEVLGKFKSIQGYFPFNSNSEIEVTLEDFTNFFAPIGTLGGFFQSYLLPFIDTNKTPWQWKKIHGSNALDNSDKSMEQINQVFRITNNLFLNNTKNMDIEFYLRPLVLTKDVANVQIQVGGKTMNYSHGPQLPATFKWPCAGQNQIKINFRDFKDQDSTLSFNGFWALSKFLDAAKIKETSEIGVYETVITIDKDTATFMLGVNNSHAILILQELKHYLLPNRIF